MKNMLIASLARQINESMHIGYYKDQQGRKRTAPCIPFSRYMEFCLYDNKHGYYKSGAVRIGKGGDFYTSSAIGSVLAEALVSHLLLYANGRNERLRLIEWGAGTGRLSAQIDAAGRAARSSWTRQFQLVLIEDHPEHAKAAIETFQAAGGDQPVILSSNEAWEGDWLSKPALILANELFDAFPVHRVQLLNGKLVELGVAVDVDGQTFYEVTMELTDSRIIGWLERDGIYLKEGQITEVHAAAADFLKRLSEKVTDAQLILIDYGHESDEYAAEHRMRGTLMCYWRHQAADEPLIRAGEQDMTSHVPFTFIRRAAEEAGWEVSGYMTQKQFLLENGVLERLQNVDGSNPFSEASRRNRAIRQLLLSDQMSEAFKVMLLNKQG